MAAHSAAYTVLSQGGNRTKRLISLPQVDISTIDGLISAEQMVMVNLNDLSPSTADKFKAVVRAIIKHRKLCIFSVYGYESDPRPICEIPEAKRLFNLAATEYGVLGLIVNKISLGILPRQIPNQEQYLQQEIDEYVACCIGTYKYEVSLGKSAFSIDLDQKERLVHQSCKVYQELYRDVI
jgi:hypothetical protein